MTNLGRGAADWNRSNRADEHDSGDSKSGKRRGDVRLSTKIDLLHIAIRGSRCLPVDPSSANLSANSKFDFAAVARAIANEQRSALAFT